ncbi:Co2+/Mg2+ efflux protein ApaG [Motiliproteus sp.]|uniref:Co2+/Mg2+ efflux protein ApaG n=1 Tax=Motiliproteus sp. TaxID=1898955 RepID=UPI003BAA86A3
MSEPISIDVKTDYLDHQSDPDNQRFVFAYHITISNNGGEAVKLLSRYWRITDGDQHVQEVEGQGVVGEQPEIEPGDSYSYTSGTVLPSEVGIMEGYYVMQSASGEQFQAPIDAFTLALPHALH